MNRCTVYSESQGDRVSEYSCPGGGGQQILCLLTQLIKINFGAVPVFINIGGGGGSVGTKWLFHFFRDTLIAS
jgi:hypothetical protein